MQSSSPNGAGNGPVGKNGPEIRIRAEPRDQNTCRFVVDRPVFPEGSAFFDPSSDTAAAPLARAILGIPGVEGVLVQDALVTVTAETGGNWRPVAVEVGRRLREALTASEPAIGAEVLESLPGPEVIRDRVEQVLRDEINPAVAAHGGHISLVELVSLTHPRHPGGLVQQSHKRPKARIGAVRLSTIVCSTLQKVTFSDLFRE